MVSTWLASSDMLSLTRRLSSSAIEPRRKLLSWPKLPLLGRWVDGSVGRRELAAWRRQAVPAHCQAVDAQGRLADAHRNALAFLAAGAHGRCRASCRCRSW